MTDAHAERQHRDHRPREARDRGISWRSANRRSWSERVEPRPAALIAHQAGHLVDAAEGAPRSERRLVRRQAASLELGAETIEVIPHLFGRTGHHGSAGAADRSHGTER